MAEGHTSDAQGLPIRLYRSNSFSVWKTYSIEYIVVDDNGTWAVSILS